MKEFPGFGVEAVFDGQRARLGNRNWVHEISTPDAAVKAAGGGDVFFAVENGPVHFFEIRDSLRSNAKTVVDHLKQMGIRVEILSGDGDEAVRKTAADLGIETFAYSRTPQEKIQHIETLQAEGYKVWVVGDGLNDAPALAAAHVSMAPSTGSDVGRLASDLVFTGESLRAVTVARNIARRTDRLVRQNFGLAIAYNMVAVPLALFGFVTPLVAAIAMSASSIAVVANSMRLNFDDISGNMFAKNGTDDASLSNTLEAAE